MSDQPLAPDDPVASIGYDREARRQAFLARLRKPAPVEVLAQIIGADDTRELKGCPFAAIDTETTGLDTSTARVVEVAVVHGAIGSDEVSVAYRTYVRPPDPLPAESTRVTGIDDAMVADAPPFARVVDDLNRALEGRLVVAFNVPYDWRVLREEYARAARTPIPLTWLDLLVVRRASKRGRPGKLVEIAQEHGIHLDAHGAAGDALATAMLATPLLRYAWSVGALGAVAGVHTGRDDLDDDDDVRPQPGTVAAVLEWQRKAALYQERDFVSYAMRTGRSTPPDCGWHAILGVDPPAWSRPMRSVACSSCRAPIVWVVTKTGAKMPVDAHDTIEIVTMADANGAPEICAALGGEMPFVRGYAADSTAEISGYANVPETLRPEIPRTRMRRSHWATCPNGEQHRRNA